MFLVAYGVGTRTELLLCQYRARLTMVARVGLYYGAPFTGYREDMQCNPLSPTIFNMAVDMVIRHWDTSVAVEYTGT